MSSPDTDSNARIDALIGELKAIEDDKSIPIIVPFLAAILSSAGIIIQIIILSSTNVPFDSIEVSVEYTANNSIVEDFSFIIVPFSIASFIASIYAVYRWVSGRNKHFVRSSKQYSIIAEIAEVLGFSKAVILKSRLNELLIVNSKKSIAINAILSAIIPFYILYVYHFMNKDFAKNSIKEKLLLTELIDDIRSKDDKFVRNIIDYEQVEEKSTFLYVVLSIITLGIFALYWAYSITKDYNEHINNHRVIDNDIINALSRITKSS